MGTEETSVIVSSKQLSPRKDVRVWPENDVANPKTVLACYSAGHTDAIAMSAEFNTMTSAVQGTDFNGSDSEFHQFDPPTPSCLTPEHSWPSTSESEPYSPYVSDVCFLSLLDIPPDTLF